MRAAGFNPRPRVGGDSASTDRRPSAACFNPRPRVGGDRAITDRPTSPGCFNPRPRVGGDPRARVGCHGPIGFNPRPRVGGDAHSLLRSSMPMVSIHAPAWGATSRVDAHSRATRFQSTPPRGGRRRSMRRSRRSTVRFNPRPRVGGDAGSAAWPASMTVSIHAPAWGATGVDELDAGCHGCVSIHAPAWGATRHRRRRRPAIDEFQSTPPRGGRRGTPASSSATC